jgi:cytochrome c-type biogenesis protein CcmH
MRLGLRALVAVASIVTAAAVVAQQAQHEPIPPIADPGLEARYQALTHEVRCLVCENRSIAESPSDVAYDLKRLIHEMVAEGKTDAEIRRFLAARYGDSVLYRPPLQPNTWLLWGGPAVLFLLGAIVFARIVRARARQPIEEDEPE